MKANVLLADTALALILSACEKIGSEETPTPTVPELTLAEQAKKYADEHSPIQGPVPLVINALPKSVKVALGPFVYNYAFGYDSQNQWISITPDQTGSNIFSITYDPAARKATGGNISFQLNQEGLAESGVGFFENGKAANNQYFYKNGYLVSIADSKNLTKIKYSSNGDLMEWSGVSHRGDKAQNVYEYTDYSNTIRQEILGWATPQFSYRGDFLGKYSSRLLKKAVINENSGNNITMEFTYSFDNKGRVSRMQIKRSDDQKVQYEYSY